MKVHLIICISCVNEFYVVINFDFIDNIVHFTILKTK